MYPGATMYIRFTCKEKIQQEKKEITDIDKGIVKWLVEMIDENEELVGIATILTMVAKTVDS
jgi:oxepin-CoA hydrolase / 3-oxo-5,6-dehydrosuberyl-CoA semialdehyde dehydrogenase